MLAREAEIPKLHILEDALESVLEQGVASLGQEGRGELGSEDGSEDSATTSIAAPVLQLRRIMKRYLEHISCGPGELGLGLVLG